MEFEYSKKTKMYVEQLTDFMNKYVYPNEKVFHDQLNSEPTRWRVPPIIEELKAKARERGLWKLFVPERDRKSTRLKSSHLVISYAVFCLKKKKKKITNRYRTIHHRVDKRHC